jgi:Na+/melibiose symporter-like transporter
LAQLGIRLLIGPVTALFFVAAAFMLIFYPLNEQRYQELMDKIKKMEKERKIQPGQ